MTFRQVLLTPGFICFLVSSAFGASATTIRTSRGTNIPVEMRDASDELTAAEVINIRNYLLLYFPFATALTGPTKMYNCHSYAWYSQSTPNNIWVDQVWPYISPFPAYTGKNVLAAYWQDGSYTWIVTADGSHGDPPPYYIPSGAKVSYDGADHSAVRVGTTDFMSKWGAWPLMRHDPKYCPYTDYYSCIGDSNPTKPSCHFTLSYYR